MSAKHRVLLSGSLMVVLLVSISCGDEPAEPTSLTATVGFQHLEGYLAAPMATDGSYVYVATGGGALHKVDAQTGMVDWSYDVGDYINNPPALAGDAVLCLSSTGKLVSVDTQTGKQNWTQPGKDETMWKLDGQEIKLPIVLGCFGYDPASGMVVAGATSGKLFGFAAADGKLLWQADLGAKAMAPPTFAAGEVLIGTMDGRLQAFDPTTGGDVWQLPRVLATVAEGLISEEETEDGTTETTYTLTVKYRYLFHPDDHFSDAAGLQVSVLDYTTGAPVEFIEDGEKQTVVTVKHLVAEDHLGPRTHTQQHALLLAAPPPQQYHWPITVHIKDEAGNELSGFSTSVSFLRPDEEAPPAPEPVAGDPAEEGGSTDDTGEAEETEESVETT